MREPSAQIAAHLQCFILGQPVYKERKGSAYCVRSGACGKVGIAVDVPKRQADYAQVCAPVVFEWIARYECESPKRIGELYHSWSGIYFLTSIQRGWCISLFEPWEPRCPAVNASALGAV